jgi:transposase
VPAIAARRWRGSIEAWSLMLELRLPAHGARVVDVEGVQVVTIGIDPHKASHTAVALDAEGVTLGQLRVAADKSMLGRLRRWAAGWPQRVWAIEGASGLGRLLAQQLVAGGETVIDVPSALAARTRVLQRGHGRKSDGIDARSVAAVAQHRNDLSRVAPDEHCAVLRLLSDRRDELTSERRRAVNRLHRLLRDLRPGGAPRQLSAERASRLLATIRPADAVDIERKAMARQLIADVRRIDRALIDNRRRCAEAVATSGTTLTEIFGISEVLAAKILGHTGKITRFASADHYASYTGTAPIEVSSGDQTRHRLSRAGNRSLNYALHMAARVQTMHPGPGRTHYQRKRTEHKTSAEALRSLKRQLAKVVYRHLRNDHVGQPSPLPALT